MKSNNCGRDKKVFFMLILFMLLVVNVVGVAAVSDVAYIYRSSSKVDDNILDVFKDLGLSVDLIDEQKLPLDLSGYRFVFVGDERFRQANKIHIEDYASIVANYYFGKEWGLTDYDGISKLAANSPLSVEKNNKVLQVYTKATYNNRPISIPYYYLDDENKVPEMESVARTYTGDDNKRYNFGDVISYANAGVDLINGESTRKRVCFFGIIESDYWTPAARELFEECVGFVGVTCERDSDCPKDKEGDKKCVGDDIYQEIEVYECENPGEFDAECVKDDDSEFDETCDYACYDGECVRCDEDSDCDDGNVWSEDICKKPGTKDSYCTHEKITCFEPSDCGLDKFTGDRYCCEDDTCVYQDFIENVCVNPETSESKCLMNIGPRWIEDCDDMCDNGECVDFVCENEGDCDDDNERTWDECVNPSSANSFCRNTEMNCLYPSDCGATGYIGESYCFDEDVWKTYQTAFCENPKTLESFCTINIFPELIQDCDDGNDYTIDSCVENGHAYCEHEFLECLSESDCDDDYYTEWEYSCVGEDVYKERDLHDFSCVLNGCEEDITCENQFVENCEYGCDNGECLDECVENEDCGDVHYSDNYCIEEDVYRKVFTPVCIFGGCEEEMNTELIKECAYGCADGECLDECSIDSDCGENYCDEEWEKRCDGSAVYEFQTCYNFFCDYGECGKSSYEKERYVGHCEYGCENGECLDECSIDSDCEDDYYTEWENYCVGEDVYRERDLHDFSCVVGGCEEEIIWKNEFVKECAYGCADGECLDECSEHSDCGDVHYSDNYCIEEDVYRKVFTPVCIFGGCEEEMNTELVEKCAYVCVDGDCVDECVEHEDCDDGIFCNGAETCVQGTCQNAEAVDCSVFNKFVNECYYNPDDNPRTFDFYEFNSYCSEELKGCMLAPLNWEELIEHTCSIEGCEAECVINENCAEKDCDYLDGCIGDDWYDYEDVENDCVDCACEENECEIPEPNLNDPRCIEEQIHDVALIDFENSIGGIKLKDLDGAIILEEPAVLNCNQEYEVWIKVENQGDFSEDVIFSGGADGVLFSHLPIDDFIPGDTNEKYRTINFSLEEGVYDLSVQAIIYQDDNPLNNFASRQIEIVCEEPPECIDTECEQQNYCNDWESVCQDGDVYETRTCYEYGCENNECAVVNTYEENRSEDCGEDEYGDWNYYCADDDSRRTRYYTNRGCSNAECFEGTVVQDELVEECDYRCVNGYCIERECDTLDLVFLIDSNGVDEWGSTSTIPGEFTPRFEWETVCSYENELIDTIEDEKIDLNYDIYDIQGGDTHEATRCRTGTALKDWSGSQYHYLRADESGEEWGPALKWLVENYDWRDDAKKLVILISDTDPSGREETSSSSKYHTNGWRTATNYHSEASLIERAYEAAQDNGVMISVAGSKIIESNTKDRFGSASEFDIYEAWEKVADETGGISLLHERNVNDLEGDILEIVNRVCGA